MRLRRIEAGRYVAETVAGEYEVARVAGEGREASGTWRVTRSEHVERTSSGTSWTQAAREVGTWQTLAAALAGVRDDVGRNRVEIRTAVGYDYSHLWGRPYSEEDAARSEEALTRSLEEARRYVALLEMDIREMEEAQAGITRWRREEAANRALRRAYGIA